jgi:uncharacterized protein (DUF2141 family)
MPLLRPFRARRHSSVVSRACCFETLESRQLLSCTVDIHMAGGAKSAVVTAGEVLNLQVWATITGTESGSDQGLQDTVGSFIGTGTASGSVLGNLAASVLYPFNATASQNGTSQDLNGDGGDDVGGTDPSSTDGYFAARADSMQFNSGVVSGDSQSFEIGTLSYTVTAINSGAATDINFSLYPADYACVWTEDGNKGENAGIGSFSAGTPFVVTASATTPPANTASIAGTVSTSTGGLSGVTVYLDANNDGALDNNETSTTTGSGGAYSFSGLAAGSYVVRQVLPSGDTQTVPTNGYGNHVTLSASQSVTGLNFTDTVPVAATGSISGAITSSAGGISGVTVYLDANNDGALDNNEVSTTTGSGGAYSFTGLAAGTYIVRQVLPSGDTQTAPANGYGNRVTVAAGQSATGANFTDTVPVVTGSISGSVASSAGGISGVTVYLDANNDGSLDNSETSTTTSSTGSYSFTGLTAGTYIVRQVLPSGDTQTAPANGYGNHETLSAGQSITGVNFTDTVPASGASISGSIKIGSAGVSGVTVYLDANNNSILDSGEKSTTTNSSGAYSFTGLAAGAYIVRQVLPAGDTQTSPSNNYGIHVTLAANGAANGQNFTDITAATITGTVFNDANGDGVDDNGEAGLAGVEMYIDLTNSGAYAGGDPEVATNSSGVYSFTGLAAGTYIVRAIKPAGYTQTTPTSNYGQHITVAAGQTYSGVLFGLHKS